MSVPNFNPARSTAVEISSRAARFSGRLGANPPSSPSPVDSPCFLRTDLSEW